MILELICSKNYHPMRAKDMAALLQIPKGKRKDLLQVLDALEEEGKITCSKRGLYRRAEKKLSEEEEKQVIQGTFLAHPRGFGFVEAESLEEDLFIPEGKQGEAYHLDQIGRASCRERVCQ